MQVSILCPDGIHYVRVCGDGTLDAQASRVDVWETLELEEFENGRFALKTLPEHPRPNHYVRAVAGGGGQLIADRETARNHEKFTLERLADDKVAIRTNSDNYWRAKNLGGGVLDCQATAINGWERFTITVR